MAYKENWTDEETKKCLKNLDLNKLYLMPLINDFGPYDRTKTRKKNDIIYIKIPLFRKILNWIKNKTINRNKQKSKFINIKEYYIKPIDKNEKYDV